MPLARTLIDCPGVEGRHWLCPTKLHAFVCMADLNAVTLNDSVICRHKAFEVGDAFVQSGHRYSCQIR